MGTHDLSPIFQSVSHAYQLCNKVSQLSEEPAWNENLAKKKIVAASTHGKRRGGFILFKKPLEIYKLAAASTPSLTLIL